MGNNSSCHVTDCFSLTSRKEEFRCIINEILRRHKRRLYKTSGVSPMLLTETTCSANGDAKMIPCQKWYPH